MRKLLCFLENRKEDCAQASCYTHLTHAKFSKKLCEGRHRNERPLRGLLLFFYRPTSGLRARCLSHRVIGRAFVSCPELCCV
jgi:hypothetical protein